MGDSLLRVEDLHTEFPGPRGTVRAVDGVDLKVEAGEIVAVVGESGCGKTMLALSILRLLPAPGRIVSGRILLEGADILSMDNEALRRMRGSGVSMSFQDPMSALNPLTRIGAQIKEAMTAHDRFLPKEAARRVLPLMGQVRIPGSARRVSDYPHQFSGGMRQRVMIAMGLSNQAQLLIADEPTTALDMTTQAEIVRLLRDLNRDLGTAMIIITHNMALAAGLCHRVVVMYAGRIVEEGPVEQIFAEPQHPYTWALLRSAPRADVARWDRLISIAGLPPDLAHLPPGCTFQPRCAFGVQRCVVEEPCLSPVGLDHQARCWVLMSSVGEAAKAAVEDARPHVASARSTAHLAATIEGPEAAILRLDDIHKHYLVLGRPPVRAVDGVSLELRRGETLGLIGESGCGKSTLALVSTLLSPPTSGSVIFEGRDLAGLRKSELRECRRDLQIVFQDPFASLDPRMTVGEIVAEPLDNFRVARGDERRRRVQNLLDVVGLDPGFAGRYPHEFSGGQRQRIGIARALALRPSVIVCDEPVSALDVSIQAQIINLLRDLQREYGLTYLFIAHDLGIVRHLCDRVAVMYLGKIAEIGAADQVYRSPQHPYTRLLLDSIPVPDPRIERRRKGASTEDELPSLVDGVPSGCRFHTRCPIAVVPGICAVDEPRLAFHGDGGQRAACHLANPIHPREE